MGMVTSCSAWQRDCPMSVTASADTTTHGYTLPMTSTLDAYCEWLASWGASDRTIVDRRRYVGRHLERYPLGASTDDLTAILAAHQGWTATTYYGHLRSYYGWAARTGRLAEDPTRDLRRPRTPRSQPRPLTADELHRALEASSGDVRAYLLLASRAGLRAHEIAKIRGEDVTEDAIYVTGKGGKTAMIPTHPDLWALAQTYPRQGWWFAGARAGEPRSRHAVTLRVGRHFDALGIEGGIHRCRHYYGTALLRSGVNLRIVQTLMRHESLATTAGYLAVDEDERRAAILGLVA